MNYGTTRKYGIANGEGVKVSSFVSGCSHHCTNCFNQEAWDFAFGRSFTGETRQEIPAALSPEYINNLTLLGGKPFEPENQRVLAGLLRQVKEEYPQKNIWCYTGYLLGRELLQESRTGCEITDGMLDMIDVLVDGRFVEELKNISLAFKGPSDQRIIDARWSLHNGHIVIKI